MHTQFPVGQQTCADTDAPRIPANSVRALGRTCELQGQPHSSNPMPSASPIRRVVAACAQRRITSPPLAQAVARRDRRSRRQTRRSVLWARAAPRLSKASEARRCAALCGRRQPRVSVFQASGVDSGWSVSLYPVLFS
ncbi:hypothetical protein CERSUDRAFT_99912 [Gelatoporia subvermispora B]|uniref:Uncharacterized protein n=1 Tax=Ceriporiopsis subvermispora (strain B) TaxID=914234 RepID=M2P955_CERS8|nr:hypothetical protein CERSUDRAFT_99912 [Gelatoporia subvermispora B]